MPPSVSVSTETDYHESEYIIRTNCTLRIPKPNLPEWTGPLLIGMRDAAAELDQHVHLANIMLFLICSHLLNFTYSPLTQLFQLLIFSPFISNTSNLKRVYNVGRKEMHYLRLGMLSAMMLLCISFTSKPNMLAQIKLQESHKKRLANFRAIKPVCVASGPECEDDSEPLTTECGSELIVPLPPLSESIDNEIKQNAPISNSELLPGLEPEEQPAISSPEIPQFHIDSDSEIIAEADDTTLIDSEPETSFIKQLEASVTESQNESPFSPPSQQLPPKGIELPTFESEVAKYTSEIENLKDAAAVYSLTNNLITHCVYQYTAHLSANLPISENVYLNKITKFDTQFANQLPKRNLPILNLLGELTPQQYTTLIRELIQLQSNRTQLKPARFDFPGVHWAVALMKLRSKEFYEPKFFVNRIQSTFMPYLESHLPEYEAKLLEKNLNDISDHYLATKNEFAATQFTL